LIAIDTDKVLRQASAAWTTWFSRTIGFPLLVNGRWRRDKDRGRFLDLLQAQLASQHWPLEQLQALQLERLTRIVEHAGQRVPYYRDLFRSAGFDPRGMRCAADLQGLPILTRAIVKAQGPRLLSDDAASRGAYPAITGGSTGVPLQVWHDAEYRDQAEAAEWLSDMAMGWRPGARVAMLWGSNQDIRHSHGWRGRASGVLRNRHLYDAYDLSEARLLHYHRAMQAAPPDILVAYASTITLLANFLEANGLRPTYPRVALICSAETLDQAMRAILERVFGPKVFNRYGSREVGVIAYECQRHGGLHLYLPDHYVECQGTDIYTEPGELILTTLHNYSMPLIRYQMDDLAIMAREACPCERESPLFREVVGRSGITFVSASGTMIHGFYFTGRIRAVPGVMQFQLVQEDLRWLRVLVVAGRGFALEGFDSVRATVRRVMGADCSLTIELVDRIPPLPSGKAELMISKVPIHLRTGQPTAWAAGSSSER
jgi:phenylacetate-CoA ligase